MPGALSIKSIFKNIEAIKNPNDSKISNILAIISKVLATLGCTILIICLIPEALLLSLFTLPLLTRFLFMIASPVNQIINPLAKYLNTEPLYITLVAIPLILASIITTSILLSSSSSVASLIVAAKIINCLDIIMQMIIIKTIYNVSPLAGISMMVLNLLRLSLPLAEVAIKTLHQAITFCLASLRNLSFHYIIIDFFTNFIEQTESKYSNLPMPQENLAPESKQTILKGVHKTLLSNSLFNTDENNVALSKDKSPAKSSWQQASCFFGLHTSNKAPEASIDDDNQDKTHHQPETPATFQPA